MAATTRPGSGPAPPAPRRPRSSCPGAAGRVPARSRSAAGGASAPARSPAARSAPTRNAAGRRDRPCAHRPAAGRPERRRADADPVGAPGRESAGPGRTLAASPAPRVTAGDDGWPSGDGAGVEGEPGHRVGDGVGVDVERRHVDIGERVAGLVVAGVVGGTGELAPAHPCRWRACWPDRGRGFCLVAPRP